MNAIVWCLTAAFLAVDLVLALSLLEWWLTREPEPTLTRAKLDELLAACAAPDSALDVDANNCCGFCPCVTDNAPLSECECLFPTLAAWRAAK